MQNPKTDKAVFFKEILFFRKGQSGPKLAKNEGFFLFLFFIFLKFLNFFIMYQISSNYVDILLLNIAVILC